MFWCLSISFYLFLCLCSVLVEEWDLGSRCMLFYKVTPSPSTKTGRMHCLTLPHNLTRTLWKSASRPVWLTSPIAKQGARTCCDSPPQIASICSRLKGGTTCWLGSESSRITVTQMKRSVLERLMLFEKPKDYNSMMHFRSLISSYNDWYLKKCLSEVPCGQLLMVTGEKNKFKPDFIAVLKGITGTPIRLTSKWTKFCLLNKTQWRRQWNGEDCSHYS